MKEKGCYNKLNRMSKLKKLLLSLIILIQLFGFSAAAATTVQAQSNWYNQDLRGWYQKVYDSQNPSEIFGERYTAAQVQWVIYSFFTNVALIVFGGNQDLVGCAIVGNVNTCGTGLQKLVADAQIFKIPDSDKSLFALLFEDRPLSAVTYVKDVIRKAKLVPEAQAQTSPGFGFRALSLVRDAWRTMRDIVFGLFVLAAIVLAFMIMFRVKISPQTVISVQAALPKFVITIVLVTFSYAIAGFLVDIMYVFIGLISLFFSTLPIAGFYAPTAPDIFELITKGPTVGGTGGALPEAHTGIFGLLISYWVNFLFAGVLSLMAWVANTLARLTSLEVSGIIGGTIVQAIGVLIGIIALVVILIWIFIALFKITFMMIKTFAILLILTIFSPFYLLLGLVTPAFSFTRWLKTYASKLAVFPTVGILFLLSFWLLGLGVQVVVDAIGPTLTSGELADLIRSFSGQAGPSSEWLADFNARFADGWPPLLGGMPETAGLILAIASAAILFQTTKAAEMVEKLIAGQPFSFGAAIGEIAGYGKTGAYGYANLEAARVGAKFQQQQADVLKGLRTAVDPDVERANRIWSLISGVSGGRVRYK